MQNEAIHVYVIDYTDAFSVVH
jgi:hypothetical protein